MPKFNSHVELLKGAHIKALRAASYDTGTPEYPPTNYLGETFYDTQENTYKINTTGSAGAANWDYILRAGMDVSIDGAYTFDRGAATAPFLVAQSDAATVTNLDADKVDGYHGSANASANTMAQRYTAGRLRVGEPSESSDAVTKSYADALFSGVGSIKEACRYVVYSNTTNVTTSAPATIDGESPSTDDRILVAAQSTASQNGIWLYKGSGNPMVRAADANQDGELKPGSMVYVTDGATNADTSWAITDVDGGIISPGTTAHSWALIDRVGEISAGNGIDKTGSVFSLDADEVSITATGGSGTQAAIKSDWIGQASITTVGTIGTGTWQGTTIARDYGGTGQTTYAEGDLLVGNGSNGLDKLTKGTEGYILKSGASDLEWYDKVKFLASTVEPVTTNVIDIGTDSKRFKDGYFEGDLDIDGTLDVEGEILAPTIQSQRIGRQGNFAFDGNDYLSGTSDDFGTSDFTLVYDVLWDNAPTGVEYIARSKVSGNNRWEFWATATQYRLLFVNNSGGTTTYTWTVTPSVNHRNVIVSADRSGNATLYLNGASQGTQDISANSSVNFGSGNTGPQYIANSGSAFNGKMFAVKYYTEAKTEAQALRIAQGFNDTENLWMHLAESSTESWGWRDISPNQRSAISNGATRIESPINKSFVSETDYIDYRKLDGGYRLSESGNQYIETADILLDGDFSIILTAELKSTSSATRWLASSDNGGTSTRQFEIYQTTAGVLTIQIGGSNYISANVSPGLDEVATLAVVLDESAASLTCYINGIKIPLNQTVNTFTSMGTTALPIRFGDPKRTTGDLAGTIHEARIFNYALSDSDIKSYSRGAATQWVDIAPSISGLLDAETATLTSGWSSSGTASTANGTATFDGSGGSITKSSGVPVSDKRYTVTVTVGSYTSGSLRIIMGDSGTIYDLEVNASGDFIITGVADGTNLNLVVYGYGGANGNFNGTVTDVQIKYAGEIANYSPQSATTTIWEDTSGLENHAIVNGAELLKPQLQETYVTEQDFIGSEVGKEASYYFDGNDRIDNIDENAINQNSWTWVVDLEPKDDSAPYGIFYGLGTVGPFFNRRYLRYNSGVYDVTIGDSPTPVLQVSYPPERARVIFTHDEKTSQATLYINGKKVAAETHSNQFDVASTPMNNNVTDIGSFGAGTFYKGQIYSFKSYNRVLTAEEIDQVSRGQKVGGYADYGASGAPDYSSNFATNTNSWVISSRLSSLTGANTGVSDGSTSKDDVLNVSSDGSTGTHAAVRGLIVPGKRYRITVEYLIPSGNTTTTAARIARSADGQSLLELPVQGSWATATGEFLNDSTSTAYLIRHVNSAGSASFTGTSGDQVHIASMNLTPVGLTLDLDPCNIAPNVWRDNSGNNYSGTVVGATPINHRQNFYTKDIYISRHIYDAYNDNGTENQVITRTANGAEWADVGTASGFVTGSGTGKQIAYWTSTGTSSDVGAVDIYVDTTNDFFGFGAAVTTPTERIQTDGNVSLLTNGAHIELPKNGSFTYNAYYDAATETDWVTRATGYAAQFEQESDGDLVLKVTTGSLAADTALSGQWTDRITIKAATNQVDFSGDITAADATFSGDVTLSAGQLEVYEKITTNRDSLSTFIDEDDNAVNPENRYWDLKFGTTQRFKVGFDGVVDGFTRVDQIASVGTGSANNLYRYLDDQMTGTWSANYDKVQMFIQGSGYVGSIDNQHGTWTGGETHVKGTSYFWKPLRASSTDGGTAYSNWTDGPSFGYDVLKDAWVINGSLVLSGIVFNTTVPPARVFTTTVTTHGVESSMDYHLINHGLGTEKVVVQVFEWASSKRGQQVFCDVWASDDSTNVTDAAERDADTANNLTIGVLGGQSTQQHLVMVMA